MFTHILRILQLQLTICSWQFAVRNLQFAVALTYGQFN